MTPVFVHEMRHDSSRFRLDDVASRWIRPVASNGKGYPARLVRKFDARLVFRRHHSIVKHVNGLVKAIHNPHFFFVRSQSHPVAWTAMPFHRSGLEAGNFDAMANLSGLEVADFKTE